MEEYLMETLSIDYMNPHIQYNVQELPYQSGLYQMMLLWMKNILYSIRSEFGELIIVITMLV